MKERRGTYLPRDATVLADWVYSLAPYGLMASALFCRAVLGWSDVPFWRVWYPIFLLSIVGRYGVYLTQFVYGWFKKRSWFSVAIDAAATLVTVIALFLEKVEVSLFWRWYIISVWLGGGGVLAIWLLQRVGRDLEAWWQTGDGDVPCQSFRQYVQSLNHEAGMNNTEDIVDAQD